MRRRRLIRRRRRRQEWRAGPPLLQPRAAHAGVVVGGGGRLWVLGGSGADGHMLPAAEVLDLPSAGGGGGGGGGVGRARGEWRLDPSGLPPGRRFGAAAVVVRGAPADE